MRGVRPLLLGFTVFGLAAATPSRPAQSVLPFIHDDYAKALTEARARNVPIFIETTARW